MTNTNLLASLISKIVGIRVFVKNEVQDANKHPEMTARGQLEGFLRVTQAELLEGLGVKNPKKLTVTVRKSIAVLARIHKGCDSYGVVADKAEVLIKRLSPIYVLALEQTKLEAQRIATRNKLEQSFAVLSGGKALPDGTASNTLEVIINELRSELEETTRVKMEEVNELALKHPNIGRVSDKNLIAFAVRLNERLTVLRRMRPVTHKPFAKALSV